MGIQHQYVLYLTIDMGDILSARGDQEGRRSRLPRLAESRRTALGDDHPATTYAANYLASALANAGQLQEAIKLREQNLRACERVMGPEHPLTIFDLTVLGTCYDLAGQADQGEAFARQALERSQRELGDDDNMTVRCRKRLLSILQHRGKVREAEQLDQAQKGKRPQSP